MSPMYGFSKDQVTRSVTAWPLIVAVIGCEGLPGPSTFSENAGGSIMIGSPSHHRPPSLKPPPMFAGAGTRRRRRKRAGAPLLVVGSSPGLSFTAQAPSARRASRR